MAVLPTLYPWNSAWKKCTCQNFIMYGRVGGLINTLSWFPTVVQNDVIVKYKWQFSEFLSQHELQWTL